MKKVCRALIYFEYFLIFISALSGCISNSGFSSLVGVLISITSSVAGLKIFTINAGIKNYKKTIKKKKRAQLYSLIIKK